LTPAPKLLGSVRLKLRVALASLAVLLIGSLIAPRATESVLSPPEERAAPLIEEQAQARAAVRPFEGVQHVRTQIRGRIVAVLAPERSGARVTIDFRQPVDSPPLPAGFGVVVTSTGDVLTHESALRTGTSIRIAAPDGQVVDARVRAYEPATGLVLLAMPATADESLPVFSDTVEAGSLVVAYARSDGIDTVVPVFVTAVDADRYAIAPTGGPLPPGTPVYTLSGELLAIATGSAERPRAIAARAGATRLLASVATGAGQPSSIGVAFQPLDRSLAAMLGQTGALVADVVPSGPADAAGVAAGDVLVAVGDTVVQSPEAAHTAITSLAPATSTSIRVRRGDRTLTLEVTPLPAFEIAALAAGGSVAAKTASVDADDLFPRSALEAAGVARGARVISINRRPVSSRDDALRELRRKPASVLLLLQRPDGSRSFAVVDLAS
jgi:S1-C subfamily serine protease